MLSGLSLYREPAFLFWGNLNKYRIFHICFLPNCN